MNNAKEIQEQYRQYRNDLYRQYPQAAAFENTKRKFAQVLMLLCAVIHLAGLYRTGTAPGASMGYETLKALAAMGTEFIFLLAAMGPRRRLAPMLYLLSLYRLAFLGGTDLLLPDAIAFLSKAGFQQEPLSAAIILCAVLYGLLILAVALWLTLLPKNKELGEQSEQIYLKLQQFAAEHPVK